MPLTKLQFRPGINQEITSYSNEGGWRDGDKVRFRLGYPEKIGGWEKYSTDTYVGSARSLHNWLGLDGSNYLGIGTHWKYYIEEGTILEDITPIRATTAAGDVTFAADTTSPFSSVVTVTDTSHGAEQFDFVRYTGTASLGGNITASVLDGEHQITRVVDADTYEITLNVTSNASDTGNGGSSVVGQYQINVGLDTTVGGTGWGSGPFAGPGSHTAVATTLNGAITFTDTTITLTSTSGLPTSGYVVISVALPGTSEVVQYTGISGNDLTGCVRGLFNTPAASHATGTAVTEATYGWGMGFGLGTTTEMRLWSHDNFGEDLLINPIDSNIYYWDKGSGTGARAVELSAATTGAASGSKRSVPQVAKQVLVSEQRHVIAFATDSEGATETTTQGDGVQDPLLIRFASRNYITNWWPLTVSGDTEESTAGSLRIGSGSQFMQAIETKREILVWTDTSLSSMRFIGGEFVFGLTQLASNITIMSPNSAAATEDFVFWMGIDNFYVYAGQTQQLPCTVKDKVFQDFNFQQKDKVTSGVNSEFSEITWFYPSANSDDNDRYVTYNYGEKVWTIGTIERTAWIDRGSRIYPIAVHGGYLYNHELGYDDDGSAMTSFIESAVMDIGDGDKFAYIRKLIPDLTFAGSANLSSPQAEFTLKARNNPGAGFDSTGSGTSTRTQTLPVEEYTEQLDVRVRGRSFALRVESNALGSKWKLGSPRVDIRQDGKR